MNEKAMKVYNKKCQCCKKKFKWNQPYTSLYTNNKKELKEDFESWKGLLKKTGIASNEMQKIYEDVILGMQQRLSKEIFFCMSDECQKIYNEKKE